MHNLLLPLRTFVQNPIVNFSLSLILLVSALLEAGGTLFADLGSGRIRVHHGLIVFALFHMLKTLPDMFEGLEGLVEKGVETEE